jgi:thymidylate kinase
MYNRKPFIVFEGIEGSGKSLHSKSLIDQLKKKKYLIFIYENQVVLKMLK